MILDSNPAILYPLLAQVGLTALVWLRMYQTRIAEIRRRRIKVQRIADALDAARELRAVAGPSDNFSNQFEVPVLFYVWVLLVYATGLGDDVAIAAAWIFVALRALHALIHVSYNGVMHRFFFYLLSTLLLWVMWLRSAWQIIGA